MQTHAIKFVSCITYQNYHIEKYAGWSHCYMVRKGCNVHLQVHKRVVCWELLFTDVVVPGRALFHKYPTDHNKISFKKSVKQKTEESLSDVLLLLCWNVFIYLLMCFSDNFVLDSIQWHSKPHYLMGSFHLFSRGYILLQHFLVLPSLFIQFGSVQEGGGNKKNKKNRLKKHDNNWWLKRILSV